MFTKKPIKKNKPGDMFNKFQTKKKTLRSPDAVVTSEQNASHQFTKGKKKSMKKKMTNIGITKKGGKKTNIGVMGQTSKQTEARKKTKKKLSDIAVGVYKGVNKVGAKIGKMVADRKQAQKNFENRSDNSNYYGSAKSWSKNKK